MQSKVSLCNVENVERRKSWIDRRVTSDRRNQTRLRLQQTDSRSGVSRRLGDYSGVLTEGLVWWQHNK